MTTTGSIFDTPSHAMKGYAMKKNNTKKQENYPTPQIIPAQKVINALYSLSYYGKDLLEASGKSNKASILLRDKIEEQCKIFTWPSWKDEKIDRGQFADSVISLIESFAIFIFDKDEQIEYFCKSMAFKYDFFLDGELSVESILPQ